MPYTTHGHWYGPGEPTQPGPRLVAKCGGPGLCYDCGLQAGLKQRPGDQPLPVPNGQPDVQSMVIADVTARREVGIQRYGTALQPHNGRDALRDLYEELLDACMYIRQVIAERDLEATGQPAEDEPEPEEDSCRLVEVDGEPVRIRGGGDMDEEGRTHLSTLFRAARAAMKAEKEAEEAAIRKDERIKVVKELREQARVEAERLAPYRKGNDAIENAIVVWEFAANWIDPAVENRPPAKLTRGAL